MKSNFYNLTKVLNEKTSKCIRWCTPSIDLTTKKVKNYYKSDISLSYQGLGFPIEPSGIFLEAYKKAAIAYGSDKTIFCVNGSTGSNFIVLRSLSKQIRNLRVLALRNIHMSVLNACEDYGINIDFIPPHVDSHLQIFFPNTLNEIIRSIRRKNPHVLLITNPTYEGLSINLKKLIKMVRKINPKLIVFIDEAWGSHLSFSDKLPLSAMQCGADICIQSTHKHGGALQQTSMIHWREERIKTELLMDSYRKLTSSSPSYILLASMDAARENMESFGDKIILRSLKIAKLLSDEVVTIPRFRTVKMYFLKNKSASIYSRDNTKVILDITRSGYTGFELSKELEDKYNIIVEKYNANTILFLVPFQSNKLCVRKTIEALREIISTGNKTLKSAPFLKLEVPKSPKKFKLKDVVMLLRRQVEVKPLEKAVGRISAENIIPYPPGIPTTIRGEKFTSKSIAFYKSIRNYPNSHVIANDATLSSVLVTR